MKFKNAEALQIWSVLQRVNETGRLGYAIAKNRRKFGDELKEYVEARDGIIRQFGVVRDGEDHIYDLPTEKAQEVNDLDSMDCEIDVTQVDDNVFCSGGLITDDMVMLDWMVNGGI